MQNLEMWESMKKYEEFEEIHKKAINILRDHNIFTFLSVFIEQCKWGLSDLCFYSITEREPTAKDKRFEADPTKDEIHNLIFKPTFKHFSYSIHSDSDESPTNLQISIDERHSDGSTLECVIFKNDNLVLDFWITKNDSEDSYNFSEDYKIILREANLSKTWFACWEIIHNRIVELDSIERDERNKSEEEEIEASIRKFDLGEFD